MTKSFLGATLMRIGFVTAMLTLFAGCFNYDTNAPDSDSVDSDAVDSDSDTGGATTNKTCTDDNSKEYSAGEYQDDNHCKRCDGATGDWIGNTGVPCASDGNKCNGTERCDANGDCVHDGVDPCGEEADFCAQLCVDLGDDNHLCQQPDDTPCDLDDAFCTADTCQSGVCTADGPQCESNCNEDDNRCCQPTQALGCGDNAVVTFDDCGLPMNDEVEDDCAPDRVCVYDPGPLCSDISPSGWHLDRINQHAPGIDGNTNIQVGSVPVNIYVVGSGLHFSHDEFAGRAQPFFHVSPLTDGSDCGGFGTAAASLAGGETLGVHPNVTLHSVRVLNCTNGGSFSDIGAGIQKVIDDHQAPAVLLYTGVDGSSTIFEMYLANAVAAGITVVVPAGNGDEDACNHSAPRAAATNGIISVASVDAMDQESGYTNYGACVELFAPGEDVTAASSLSDQGTTKSSDSISAAGVVAGAAAVALGNGSASSPAQVESFLMSQATSGAVIMKDKGGAPNSPNLLLYVAP